MKPRDLLHLSLGDPLNLSSDGGDLFLLDGGSSPLSLLSPNAGLASSPARTVKPATAAAAAVVPVGGAPGAEEEEENEPLGALPQLGGRRAGGIRRTDARRQSMAISQLFAGLSAGAGLLGDSELAVGDEDIQVPLAKSGRLLGGASNHSSLYCDPDTRDLLDTELPSPGAAQAGGGSPGAADSPGGGEDATLCDSPVLAPALRGLASIRRTPGMRASTAVFGDLRKACEEGQGLDDFDGEDFQLQESSKVKELAFLFKLDGGAVTPRASIDVLRSSADFALKHDGNSSLRSSLRASTEGGLDSIRQRLQQYHSSTAPTSAPAQQQHVAQQQAAPAQVAQYPAAPPLHQPQAHAGVGPAAAAALPEPRQLATAALPAQPPTSGKATASMPAARPATAAASEPTARLGAAAAKPAGSRLPAPPLARASRLRPPTTSSAFFSSNATASGARQPARPSTAAAPAVRPAAAAVTRSSSRVSARPTTSVAPSSITAAAATGIPNSPALSRVARPSERLAPPAAKPAERPAAPAPKPAVRPAAPTPKPAERPAPPAAKPAEQPAAPAARALPLSRLGQSSSRIPTPSKTAAPAEEAGRPPRGSMFQQRTLSAAAGRQQRAAPASTAAQRQQATPQPAQWQDATPQPAPAGAARGTPASAARVPALRFAASPAAGSPAPTPNTARLRWLEQNPDLAFGGGTKLAASPAVQPAEQAKKLSAEERHMMDWQGHL